MIQHNDADLVYPGAYVITARHCADLFAMNEPGFDHSYTAVFGHYTTNSSQILGYTSLVELVDVGAVGGMGAYDYAIFRIGNPPAGATVSDVRAYIPAVGSQHVYIGHPHVDNNGRSTPRAMVAEYGDILGISLVSNASLIFPPWGSYPISRPSFRMRGGGSGGGVFDGSGRMWGRFLWNGDPIPSSQNACEDGGGALPLAVNVHVSPFLRRWSLPVHLMAKPSTTSNSRIRASCSQSTGPGSYCIMTSSSSAGFAAMQSTGCSLACKPGETVNVRCEVLGSSQSSRIVDSVDYAFTNVGVAGESWTMTAQQESFCGAGSLDCTKAISLDALSMSPGAAPPRPLMIWCDFDED